MKALILHALVDTDSKVRRWSFNALAQLGEAADVPLMIGPWKANRSDPEIFEAGLTALAHLLSKDDLLVILKETEVRLDASALMALGQQTDGFGAELDAVRLDIDQATQGELRSATLLIGLKKAPNTLFSGRFPVSDVIGDLNTHPDPIVSQYSFWATVEHPDLGLDNVRVPPSQFSQLPPNVQGWAYRTLTKDGSKAVAHYDAIVGASESVHPEVREGVAIGLRDIYYDSLDVTVADWFVDERDPAVRDRLLEHMATHITKELAVRYVAHSRVQAWLRIPADADDLTDEDAELAEQAEHAISNFGEEMKLRHGWASKLVGKKKPTFKDIAAKCGHEADGGVYEYASQHIHFNHRMFDELLATCESEQNVLLVGPSNSGMVGPLTAAAISMVEATFLLLLHKPNLDRLALLDSVWRMAKRMNKLASGLEKRTLQAARKRAGAVS